MKDIRTSINCKHEVLSQLANRFKDIFTVEQMAKAIVWMEQNKETLLT